jgi:SAM-dependent methyltransferase
MREYDLIADWYAAQRVDSASDSSGVPEVTLLAASIRPAGRILDIGCGNGVPLTSALLALGHCVVGMDSASNMLRRFRENCPAASAVRATVQACPFASASFDAAIARGVLFHLELRDQERAFASVSRVLEPGAPFLFTAGYPDVLDESPHVGVMNGVEFRYYSFTKDGYRDVLAEHGFTLVDFHLDAGQNGYYLARKAA